MNEHPETALIEMLKGEDQRKTNEAFSQLYQQHYESIKQLVRRNNGTDEEADDIFQETLFAFYTQLRQKNLQLNCSIQTYLYSVARNLWLDELRKRKKKVKLVETHTFIPLQEDHLTTMLATEQNQQIAKIIRLLDDKCQQVLVHFYFDRYRMKKIASLLGFANEQVAKSKKSKCLKKLKTLVEERRHQFEV
ncbi:MAG: sigma-70 family RNA polymerase sigma factor [Saprospiraceae bacterium]|nr:sigma-70 family RNA polymerase sigma factor [Saprospiraceae bacterium]